MSLQEKQILVHSRYDPRKEAQKFKTRHLDQENLDLLILGGFGLGYLVESILETPLLHGPKKIIVCEHSWQMIKLALQHRDVHNILLDKRCEIWVLERPQMLKNILQKEKKNHVRCLIHPGSQQVHPDFYLQLKDQCINYQNRLPDQSSDTRTL